jgi:hypothetical protein
MLPKYHIFYGGIFSLVLSLFFNLTLIESIILFLSTWFFIDLDLVPLFIIREKSINPFLFWEKGKKTRTIWINMDSEQKKKVKYPLRLFHSIEFCMVLFLLQFIHQIFLWVLVGVIFHLIFDYIDQLSRREEIIGKFSLFLTTRRNKNKKEFI